MAHYSHRYHSMDHALFVESIGSAPLGTVRPSTGDPLIAYIAAGVCNCGRHEEHVLVLDLECAVDSIAQLTRAIRRAGVSETRLTALLDQAAAAHEQAHERPDTGRLICAECLEPAENQCTHIQHGHR